MAPAPSSDTPTPRWLRTTESILNAAVGDYLAEKNSPLAIEMSFRHRGAPVALNRETLTQLYPQATAKVAVFVHGLGDTEATWQYPNAPETSYGSLLAAALGYTPFYLHYNTGLPLADNGQSLAQRLTDLFHVYPAQVEELILVGHSMGGLVIRKALEAALTLPDAKTWRNVTRACFYLGSPHQGAPLEKFGAVVAGVLSAIPDPVVQLTQQVLDLRSAGIKDLGPGLAQDPEVQAWSAQNAESAPKNEFPEPQHYFIAALVAEKPGPFYLDWLGDGIVHRQSAQGWAAAGAEIFPGLNHLALTHHATVYTQILRWLGGNPETQPEPTAAPEATLPEAQVDRLGGYSSLAKDAVNTGATAVEKVHKKLAARPFDILEKIPPLTAPTQVVRAVHDTWVSGVYDVIKKVTK